MINSFSGQYRFLSNFYPHLVEFEGAFYPTNEHAYQAAKTLNLSARRQFQTPTLTAGQAKRLGAQLDLRDDWRTVNIGIMFALNRQKFDDVGLRLLLLATGDQELVEGNHWDDTFWGVCNGVGENWLGKVLMQVRNCLSDSSKCNPPE